MPFVRRILVVLVALAVIAPSVARAQWATVTFLSPTNGQHFTSPTITVQFVGCSTAKQFEHNLYVNGTSYTQTVTTAPLQRCELATRKLYTMSGLTLAAGYNEITAEVCNGMESPTCVSQNIPVYYDTPGISVTPDGGTASPIIVGSSGSYQFTVTNTGGPGATAIFSASCGGSLSACSASASAAYLGAGATASVTVYYTGSATGAGYASLYAAYGEYPSTSDGGSVNVTVTPKPVASVVMALTGSATIGVNQQTSPLVATRCTGRILAPTAIPSTPQAT